MGTITISIDDDIEKRFRAAAKKKLGGGKGCLGKATAEALDNWARMQTQDEIAKDALELLKAGYPLGKRTTLERKDLYDRTAGTR